MNDKKDWKDPKVWIAIVMQLIAVLATAGAITSAAQGALETALPAAILGVFSILGAAGVIVSIFQNKGDLPPTPPTDPSPAANPTPDLVQYHDDDEDKKAGGIFTGAAAFLCAVALWSLGGAVQAEPVRAVAPVVKTDCPCGPGCKCGPFCECDQSGCRCGPGGVRCVPFRGQCGPCDGCRRSGFVGLGVCWGGRGQTDPALMATLQQILQNQQQMMLMLQQQKQASPQFIVLGPQFQPKQELPGGGQPRQELPGDGAPKQVLPPDGNPKQELPGDGKPRQELPGGGGPKQELMPKVDPLPAPAGYQRFTKATARPLDVWRPAKGK